MSRSPIQIRFATGRQEYQPGDRLEGTFLVEQAHELGIRFAELSVLWYTAGKGEEDLAVHHFERLAGTPPGHLDLGRPQRYSTDLPRAPLSYDGLIVKVCWCVRLRLFLDEGQEIVRDVPFRLGSVAGPATAMSRQDGTRREMELRKDASIGDKP